MDPLESPPRSNQCLWLLLAGAVATALSAFGLGIFRELRTPDVTACMDPLSDRSPVLCVRAQWSLRIRRDGMRQDIIRAAAAQLDQSTAVRPDPLLRDQSATLLIDASTTFDPGTWRDIQQKFLVTGAWDPLVGKSPAIAAIPSVAGATPVDYVPLQDWARAASIQNNFNAAAPYAVALFQARIDQAKNAPRRTAAHACDLDADALLCLAKRTAEAIPILAQSSCGDSMKVDVDLESVRRLASLACGASTEQWQAMLPDASDRVRATMFASAQDPRALEAMLPHKPIWSRWRSQDRLVAEAVTLSPQSLTMRDVVEVLVDSRAVSEVGEIDGLVGDALSYPSLPCFAGNATQCHVPAEVLERVATKLVALLDTTPHVADPEQSEPRRAQTFTPTEVMANPRPFLSRQLWKIRLLGAMEWIRRGKLDRARDLLAHLDAPPSSLWLEPLIRVRMAAKDATGASAAIQAFMAAPTPLRGGRPVVLAYRALVQADAGDFVAAYQSALQATELPEFGAMGTRGIDLMWLRAALAIRSGHGADPWQPSIPTGLDPSEQKLYEWFRQVWSHVHSDPSLRSRLRLSSPPVAHRLAMTAPAQFYLLAALADQAGDTRVWLDRVLSSTILAYGRPAMRFRVEAARWRGDSIDETTWQNRERGLNALVVDESTAVLMAIANL